MNVECEVCGTVVQRTQYDISHRKNFYCCKEHAQLGSRHGAGVTWLSAADSDEERLLVGLILGTAADMQHCRFGSPKWERLDARHSALLDATRIVFDQHGRHVPDKP